MLQGGLVSLKGWLLHQIYSDRLTVESNIYYLVGFVGNLVGLGRNLDLLFLKNRTQIERIFMIFKIIIIFFHHKNHNNLRSKCLGKNTLDYFRL